MIHRKKKFGASKTVPRGTREAVDALGRLRDLKAYPAKLTEWAAAVEDSGLGMSELRKRAGGFRPRVVLKKEGGDLYAAFEEDIELFLDIPGALARLKDQGDPRCYPPGRARLLAALALPRGWGAMVERRLKNADGRSLPGVIARKAPRGKAGALVRFALSQDAELLELMCLNAEGLRRRVLALWVELEKLRTGRATPDCASKMGATDSGTGNKAFLRPDDGKVTKELLLRVREAVERLSRASPFHEVKMRVLRSELQDASRLLIDRALVELGRKGQIDLVRLNDRSVLSKGEEATLLRTETGLYYAAAPRKESSGGER